MLVNTGWELEQLTIPCLSFIDLKRDLLDPQTLDQKCLAGNFTEPHKRLLPWYACYILMLVFMSETFDTTSVYSCWLGFWGISILHGIWLLSVWIGVPSEPVPINYSLGESSSFCTHIYLSHTITCLFLVLWRSFESGNHVETNTTRLLVHCLISLFSAVIQVRCVASDLERKRICSGGRNGVLRLWDATINIWFLLQTRSFLYFSNATVHSRSREIYFHMVIRDCLIFCPVSLKKKKFSVAFVTFHHNPSLMPLL